MTGDVKSKESAAAEHARPRWRHGGLKRLVRHLPQTASVVAALAGIVVLTFSASNFIRGWRFLGWDSVQMAEDLDVMKGVVGKYTNSVDRLQDEVEALHKAFRRAAERDAAAGQQIAVTQLDDRLTALESALQETPAKALAMPLLKKELEELKVAYARDLEQSTKQVDRIYDQNKWFIGLMSTMAVGLITLAIGNFLGARRG